MIGNQKSIINLLDKIKDGDLKAHTKLYKYYKKTLEYFLKNKYPKNNEVDDDVSEIVLKIYENIDKYDDEKSKFNTWIINIANNYMIDKSRKKKLVYGYESNSYEYSIDNELNEENWLFDGNSQILDIPSQMDIEFEINDTLGNIINNINPIEYSMIGMKSTGYNYKEIGLEFNLTESQVSNKINYLKTKIKNNDCYICK